MKKFGNRSIKCAHNWRLKVYELANVISTDDLSIKRHETILITHTRWPKKIGTLLYALQIHQILTNFQTFFTVRIRRTFVTILSLKIPLHLKCVATLPCEMSCLKAIFENKTSVTTHIKNLTTGNNVFIVSVIVYSNCHILHFSHKLFNMSALLLNDALLKCVVTKVVIFSVVAFKTLTFHKVV